MAKNGNAQNTSGEEIDLVTGKRICIQEFVIRGEEIFMWESRVSCSNLGELASQFSPFFFEFVLVTIIFNSFITETYYWCFHWESLWSHMHTRMTANLNTLNLRSSAIEIPWAAFQILLHPNVRRSNGLRLPLKIVCWDVWKFHRSLEYSSMVTNTFTQLNYRWPSSLYKVHWIEFPPFIGWWPH